MLLIVQSPKWIPGIYNYSNEGKISWYDFALAIKSWVDTHVRSMESLLRLILRLQSDLLFIMDKTKIKTIYGVVVPDYEESLRNLWGCCKVKSEL
jgi:dTDP-4-dehydrorhamnose reductase